MPHHHTQLHYHRSESTLDLEKLVCNWESICLPKPSATAGREIKHATAIAPKPPSALNHKYL
jgi:hypothetical protein